MFERIVTYTNVTTGDQIVWMEPWCEEIRIPSGKTFTFTGHGTEDGEIEIEKRDEGIIVYGWPTSMVNVVCDGQTVWTAYFAVPQIPPGMTIRGFVKCLFHEQQPDDQPG
jgi:hypothetical protein